MTSDAVRVLDGFSLNQHSSCTSIHPSRIHTRNAPLRISFFFFILLVLIFLIFWLKFSLHFYYMYSCFLLILKIAKDFSYGKKKIKYIRELNLARI